MIPLLVPFLLAQAYLAPPPGQAPAGPPAASISEAADEAARERAAELEVALAAAERDREVGEAQRAVIQQQLGAIQQELAAARVWREEAVRAQAQVTQALDRTAYGLRALESELAVGSTENARAILERAAQAVAEALLRGAAAWIEAAQEALARSDLFAARRAIAAVLTGASGY
jgi:SpoVK/Ycf46/Vps4 family AAA+-type ATPase